MAGNGAVLGGALINSATSGGTSAGGSSNTASSASRTYGVNATNMAKQSAAQANSAAQSAWREAAQYNAQQAQIQRDWQERMANTVYQRTMADMKKAGLNPILAAQMGLGTASAGSGASASMPSAMTYMPNTYPESQSSSQSMGSSWNESLSGLAYLADIFQNALGAMSSTANINFSIQGLEDLMKDKYKDQKTGDGSKVSDNYANGTYDKPLGTTFTNWIKNPKEVLKDVGNYLTFKSSGGTLRNTK